MIPEMLQGAGGVVFAVLGLGLMALEWLRSERRWRVARTAAVLGAFSSLWAWALLAQRPVGGPAGPETAWVWTGGPAPAAPAGPRVPTDHWFALPGAEGAPVLAQAVPDLAYVRRSLPRLGRLTLLGDGLDPSEAPAAAGLEVRWISGRTRRRVPSVDAVDYAETITVGDSVEVRGRVAGLVPGSHATVILAGPDGSTRSADVVANAEGFGPFHVSAAPAGAPGRFVWTLSVLEGARPDRPVEQESLGVSVEAPLLPRLLVLAESPRLDSARLLRWYAAAGGRVTERTRVSAGRFQFANSAGSAGSFAALDARLLGAFDVVLADPGSLAALSGPERRALEAAVSDSGLGVLVEADAPPKGARADPFFMPWVFEAVAGAPAEDHLTRLLGRSGSLLPGEPVDAPPVPISPRSGQTGLLWDGQGRCLAAEVLRGTGRLAVTLVGDTWRWRQREPAGAFAAYWSLLLRGTARAGVPGEGGRLIADPPTSCVVDRPLHLFWAGPGGPPGRLGLAGDAFASWADPLLDAGVPQPLGARWDFWPRSAGWHRAAAVGGEPALDLWVARASAWPGVRSAERRATASRVVEEGSVAPRSAPDRSSPWGALGAFVAFLFCGAFLWSERPSGTGG